MPRQCHPCDGESIGLRYGVAPGMALNPGSDPKKGPPRTRALGWSPSATQWRSCSHHRPGTKQCAGHAIAHAGLRSASGRPTAPVPRIGVSRPSTHVPVHTDAPRDRFRQRGARVIVRANVQTRLVGINIYEISGLRPGMRRHRAPSLHCSRRIAADLGLLADAGLPLRMRSLMEVRS